VRPHEPNLTQPPASRIAISGESAAWNLIRRAERKIARSADDGRLQAT